MRTDQINGQRDVIWNDMKLTERKWALMKEKCIKFSFSLKCQNAN